MPNPNRPQYQDTIEETWGQAVADTVVRRYTSSADRDADLAGFTPAELAGQVVAIVQGGGVAYIEEHDGVQWHPLASRLAVGPQGLIWGTPWADGTPLTVLEGPSILGTDGIGNTYLDVSAGNYRLGYTGLVMPTAPVGGQFLFLIPNSSGLQNQFGLASVYMSGGAVANNFIPVWYRVIGV
jgi:hypothetical protein